VPFVSASRYNLSWGDLAPTFIVCEKAQRCRGIDAVIRQFEAAGVAQHVRVDLHIEAFSPTSALDHRLNATAPPGAS